MMQAETCDRDHAYVTSINPEAAERVIASYPDGKRKEAEFWLNGERVGFRSFYPTGELDYEVPYRDGVMHGTRYRWDVPGVLLSAEPYEHGLAHGTARQWGDDGRLLGMYTMERGTGIDLWWQEWTEGSAHLAEVHFEKDGRPHGFEWWLDEDQRSVYIERHWSQGNRHGIERDWNANWRLCRGYPRYWVH